jgi:hypothetical protein
VAEEKLNIEVTETLSVFFVEAFRATENTATVCLWDVGFGVRPEADQNSDNLSTLPPTP